MWMRRAHILIGLSLALFLHDTALASLAAAEWVRIGGTHKYDRYVDVTTIGVSGPKVTLWTLRDFRIERAIPGGPYRSLRSNANTIVTREKADHFTSGIIRKPWHRAVSYTLRQPRVNGHAWLQAAMTMRK